MSMFFTRDAWDEARDERIAEIGLKAYEKEVKEAREKWDRENPDYTSKTQPYVRRGDIITDDYRYGIQFYVRRVTEQGDIYGTMVTTNPMKDDPHMGAEYKWEGPYKMISTLVGEFDTPICGPNRPPIE